MNCQHCNAETTNGLALCELCQRFAGECFTYLPIYFRNLARWRPGRAGSRPVPGSRVLYDGETRGSGTGDRISDRLDETFTALTTWARMLVNDRGDFPRPLTHAHAAMIGDLPDEIADDKALVATWLCAGFDHHLTSIATLEWCGEFVRDLARHESILRGLTSLVPGWYAGVCRRRITMEQTCGAPTYVVPGLTWVTCGSCGTTTYARDHLDAVIDEAADWLARPRKIAEAVVALVDTEQSVPRLYERIKKWEQRERITGVQRIERGYDYDDATESLVVADLPVGPKRYRLGDVLGLIFAEGATRSTAAPKPKSAKAS